MNKKFIAAITLGAVLTVIFYLLLTIWSVFLSLAVTTFIGSFVYFQALSAIVSNLDEYIIQDPVTGFQKDYNPIGGIFLVFVYAMAFFGILNTIIANVYFSFPVTYIGTAVFVYLIDKYIGQEEERHVKRRKRQQDIFIESLGTGKGSCQSCKTKLDKGQTKCPNCGFEL